MIKRANGLDYNEQTGVLQLTGNNSKVGSPIQIKNNLPVTSMASGTELKVNNYKQLIKFTKEGKTEQKSYTGKNIFDYFTNFLSSVNGVTSVINDDGSITTTGKPTKAYTSIISAKNITDLLEDGQTYTLSQKYATNKLYIQVVATTSNGTNKYIHVGFNDNNKISFVIDKSTYKSYSISVLIGTLTSWGDSSLAITNKYMLCKGTDTADSSFEPYVGKQPSPSPDYPQQIENVKGVENIWFGGKSTTNNGITFTKNADGSYDITGTATAEANCFNYINIANTKLKNGINYNLSINKLTNGKVIILTEAYANETWDSHVINALNTSNSFLTNKIINIKDNITRVRYGIRVEKGQTVNIKGLKIQLEEGPIAHNFVPNGSNYLQLKNVKKNLFDKNNLHFILGAVDVESITINNVGKSFYIKCKSNTTYTISRKIVGSRFVVGTTTGIPKHGEKVYDRVVNNAGSSITLTTSSNSNYLCVYYLINSTENENNILDNIQIEEGSESTSYEPHKEKIINVDLKGNNLCSDKEQTLKDELIIENVRAKIIKKYDEVVLDGTEDWVYDSTYKYFRCPTFDFGIQIPVFNANQLSNYFNITTSWATFRDNINQNLMFSIQNTSYKICIRDVSCITAEQFKSKLKSQYDSGTPVKVQYQLAEPKVIDLGEVDLDLIENSTLTCEEESDMQIDYLTISSNIFVQDSLDGNSSQKAPSVDAIKKYFGKKVYDKDANGWIKIEFFDHIEYVYTAVVNKTFNSGWGYTDNVPFPVGVSSLGDRILTSSVICTDAAIKLNAGQYHNGKQGIGINYTNSYETALTKECIYDFRILEYK